MDYEKNISELAEEIKKKKARKILLQLPEGLKTRAQDIAERIEALGINVIISGEPCYGACDLRDREAKMMGCDMLVHVGHSKFFKDFSTSVPVLYFPWKIDVNLGNIDFSIIKEKEIAIASTIQHLHLLDELKKRLEKEEKKVVVLGQILGCYVENSDKIKDTVLLLGSGDFHATGLRGKVYRLSPERRKIELIDTLIFEKRRYANIEKAKDAKSFAILVSSKPGQFDIKRAEEIKKRMEEKHKKASILIMDEIKAEKLLGLKFDAYINTACKRITEDSFGKPIVNKEDIDLVI